MTETSANISRPGRVGLGAIAGGVLLIAAAAVLSWNEARAVRWWRRQLEGAPAVRSVSADAPDARNDGALVHTTGRAEPLVKVSDNRLNIQAPALALRRTAEMFQWLDDAGSGEGGKAPAYSTGWSERLQNSSRFKQPGGHENPRAMPVDSHTFYASNVRLGGFVVAREMLEQLSAFTPLALGPDNLGRLPEELRGGARIDAGSLYLGKDPQHPEVGDVRIKLEQIEPLTVSVVARQSGTSLTPYRTRSGTTVALVREGEHGVEQMFPGGRAVGAAGVWLGRLAGLSVMLGGAMLARRSLAPSIGRLPWMEPLVEIDPGAVAAVTAGAVTLAIVAGAWLIYCPALSVPMLLVAGAAVAMLAAHGRQKRVSVLDGGLMPESTGQALEPERRAAA